jgi:hypothetical protein
MMEWRVVEINSLFNFIVNKKYKEAIPNFREQGETIPFSYANQNSSRPQRVHCPLVELQNRTTNNHQSPFKEQSHFERIKNPCYIYRALRIAESLLGIIIISPSALTAFTNITLFIYL